MRQRRSLVKGSVRAVEVVVRHELCENTLELTSVKDQNPIQAFSSNGADEALGDAVGPGCVHRSADDPNALGPEYFVEAGRELAVPVADQEPYGNDAFNEGPRDLPGPAVSPRY